MIKTKKRFKYLKDVDDIFNILSLTYKDLKKENIRANIPSERDYLKATDFDLMQKYGCIIKWRAIDIYLINDYTVLDNDGSVFTYPTNYLRKDLAEREGKEYVKDLRQKLISEATANIDKDLKKLYKQVGLTNPQQD